MKNQSWVLRFVLVGLLVELCIAVSNVPKTEAVVADSVGMVVGCSPAVNKQVAKSAIDIGLATCIALHPDDGEAELKTICGWADEFAPLVKDLLSARQKGMAKHEAKRAAANPACSATATAPASDAGK